MKKIIGMLIIPLFIIFFLNACSTSNEDSFFIVSHHDYNEVNKFNLEFVTKAHYDDEISLHYNDKNSRLFYLSEYQYDLFNRAMNKKIDILYEKEVELVFLTNNDQLTTSTNYQKIKDGLEKLIIFDLSYDISKNLLMDITNKLNYLDISEAMQNYFKPIYKADRLIKVDEDKKLIENINQLILKNEKFIFPIWDYQIEYFQQKIGNTFQVIRLEEAYYTKKMIVGSNLKEAEIELIKNQELILFENGYKEAKTTLINNYERFELAFFNIEKRWDKTIENKTTLLDLASFEGSILNYIICLLAFGLFIFVFQTSKKNRTTYYYLAGIFLLVYSLFYVGLPSLTANSSLFYLFEYTAWPIRIYAFYLLFKSIYSMKDNQKLSWKFDLTLNIINLGLIIVIFLNPFHNQFFIIDNYAHKVSYAFGPIYYLVVGILTCYIIASLVFLRLQAKTKQKKINVYLFYSLLLVLGLNNLLFYTGYLKTLNLNYSFQILVVILGLTLTLRKFHLLKGIDDPFDFFQKINVSAAILDHNLKIIEKSPDFYKKVKKDFLTPEEYQYLVINRNKIVQTAPGFDLKADNYFRLTVADAKQEIVIMFENVTNSYREIVRLSEEIHELRQIRNLISSKLNQAESIAKENELEHYNELIIKELEPFFSDCQKEFKEIIEIDDDWQEKLKEVGFAVAKQNLIFRKSLWIYQGELINQFQATNLLEKLVDIYYGQGYEVYFEGKFLNNINPKEVDVAFETILNYLEGINLELFKPTLFRLVLKNKQYAIKIITSENEKMLLKKEVKL